MDARDYEDAYQRDDKPREVKSNRAWRLETESLRQQLAECHSGRNEATQFIEQLQQVGRGLSAVSKEQTNEIERLHKKVDCLAEGMRDVFPVAHRLALELECLLLETKDTAALSKWWDSAFDALEQWREFCREDTKVGDEKWE